MNVRLRKQEEVSHGDRSFEALLYAYRRIHYLRGGWSAQPRCYTRPTRSASRKPQASSMLFKARSAAVYGIDSNIIDVEVDFSGAVLEHPLFNMVGLPDTAVRESRDRVRSAI